MCSWGMGKKRGRVRRKGLSLRCGKGLSLSVRAAGAPRRGVGGAGQQELPDRGPHQSTASSVPPHPPGLEGAGEGGGGAAVKERAGPDRRCLSAPGSAPWRC